MLPISSTTKDVYPQLLPAAARRVRVAISVLGAGAPLFDGARDSPRPRLCCSSQPARERVPDPARSGFDAFPGAAGRVADRVRGVRDAIPRVAERLIIVVEHAAEVAFYPARRAAVFGKQVGGVTGPHAGQKAQTGSNQRARAGDDRADGRARRRAGRQSHARIYRDVRGRLPGRNVALAILVGVVEPAQDASGVRQGTQRRGGGPDRTLDNRPRAEAPFYPYTLVVIFVSKRPSNACNRIKEDSPKIGSIGESRYVRKFTPGYLPE